MSVLIKNMEMPTDRPQLLWVYPNGKALTVQSDVDPWKELQAIPVPPHGKLIDADNFIDRVKADVGMVEEDLSFEFKDWIWSVLKLLETQPTVIEAEE